MFLGRSIRDDVLVRGLKRGLERVRLTAYVDWTENQPGDARPLKPVAPRLRVRQRLRAGIDNTVMARWLSHVSIHTTQIRLVGAVLAEQANEWAA